MINKKKDPVASVGVQYLFPVLIVLIYALSRYILFRCGVIFDCSTLHENIQYIDVDLLKNHLLTSVFYQHTQPPMFNLFLGVVLKVFPSNFEQIFTLLFYICSLTIYLTMFRIFQLLKLNDWLSLFISTVFILLPDAMMYENWLMYTWPSAMLLLLAGHSMLKYEQNRESKDAVFFVTYICILCLTRSMFHLIYLLGCIVGICLMRSINRKSLAVVSLLAVLMVSSVYVKNYVVFDFFGSSSWLGPSLTKMTIHCKRSKFTGVNLSPHDPYSMLFMYPSLIQKAVANSEISLVSSFSSMYMYPSRYRVIPDEYKETPVLAHTNKPSGYNNQNFYGYLRVSRELLTDAKSLIKGDLHGYLNSVSEAWAIYMLPAWSYKFLSLDNKKSIEKYIYWLTGGSEVTVGSDLSLLVNPIIFLFVILVYGYNWVKLYNKCSLLENPMFYNFLVLTILYVAIIGNALEIGENNRFRVQTDCLMYIAFIISIKVMYGYHKINDKTHTIQ